ncbi:MAG: RNA methyltransferase, TrmA family [Firmicutes bacterium]|nr:RNA methyltransferase, TrmA family [Bacillota bacterium]
MVGMSKPVEEGKSYTIDISSMGNNGEGIGRLEGFTIFVEGAVPGDRARVAVSEVKKKYARARLQEIIVPSGQRIESRCPAASDCGGCQIQHIDYKWQLEHKARKVADSIKRIGGLEDVMIHPIIGMEEPWRYRNKAQFPVGGGVGNPRAGFYAKGSHDIVEVDDCIIQHETNRTIIDEVRQHMIEYEIPAYDETTGEGVVRHVVTRVGFATGEIMVIIVVTRRYFPGKDELVERLADKIPGIHSIILNINDRNTNVILGTECITLWGNGYIRDFIGELEFHISPLSFFQVNPVQTQVLYSKALEYAGLSGTETVVDAYCGIGTISLFLAQKAGKVYGIEVVKEAVEDARKNAVINGIQNVEFIAGQAEDIMPGLYREEVRPDVVVVDPPRKGCDERLLDTITGMEPDRVVYVSCNPATLARDLAYLDGKGYRTLEVQPVDMFPHTAHVETIILLQRQKP